MSIRSSSLNYVICATHRTGSNLLSTGLLATGIAGLPLEYFMHIKGRAGPLPDLAGMPCNAFNKRMFEYGTTPNGVFGIKIMWESMLDANFYYSNADRYSGLYGVELLRSLLPGLKCVFVTRREKTRQAVSLLKAEKSGFYFELLGNVGKQDACRAELQYDYQAIAIYRDMLIRHENSWLTALADAEIEPHIVVYEEFVDDYEGTLRGVLEYLGITGAAEIDIRPTCLRKQADAISEEWVRRYEREISVRRTHDKGL